MITVLFLLLALSDFTKALQYAGNPAVGGLVILGHKFHGVAHNLILGPLFGIVLLIYAYGIWNLRTWALPLFNRVCVLRADQHGPVLVAAPTAAADRAIHLDLSVPFPDGFDRHRDLSRLPSRASALTAKLCR